MSGKYDPRDGERGCGHPARRTYGAEKMAWGNRDTTEVAMTAAIVVHDHGLAAMHSTVREHIRICSGRMNPAHRTVKTRL